MTSLSSRDASILRGIIDHCCSIESRIERYRIDRDVFTDNADYREMLLFPLIQIGELANHFSDEFLREHGDTPWSDIVGMRHIVVHGYDTIDCSWAWSTLANDIKPLRMACEAYLDESE